jgi:hypothetical protein
MANETQPENFRELWQRQEVENVTITIDEIQKRAARLERRIRGRNLREYAAGVIVIALFALAALRQPGWRAIPQWLLVAGTIYVLVQLHRRGSARSIPADAGLVLSLRLHREELERQRNALRSIWSWYLLPIVPGLVALLIVTAIGRGINVAWWLLAAGFPLVFAGLWKLNHRAAQRLDRQISELKSMEEPGDTA